MNPSPQRRDNGSSIARATYWGSRASSAAMQFAVPPAIGFFIDHKYGTRPWGVAIGAVLGFASGMRGLLLLVKQMDKALGKKPSRKTENTFDTGSETTDDQ